MTDHHKIEFASDAWFDALHHELTEGLAGEDLSGIDFTMSEEYLEPPDHLRPANGSPLGFHYRIRDGVLKFCRGPLPREDADISVVGSYEFIHNLAVRTHQELESYERPSPDDLVASGRMTVHGDWSRRPEVLVKLNVHDRIAVRTL